MRTELSWTGGPETTTAPWYNAQRALGTPCPADCAPCAKCLARDKETLARLARPAGCDCAGIEIRVGPCHGPGSCERFCARHGRLAAMCGESDEDAEPDSERES